METKPHQGELQDQKQTQEWLNGRSELDAVVETALKYTPELVDGIPETLAVLRGQRDGLMILHVRGPLIEEHTAIRRHYDPNYTNPQTYSRTAVSRLIDAAIAEASWNCRDLIPKFLAEAANNARLAEAMDQIRQKYGS